MEIKQFPKTSTNAFGFIMHVFAIFIGFMETSTMQTEYVTHQTLQALWSIKYVLYAILFEIVALHCKNKE